MIKKFRITNIDWPPTAVPLPTDIEMYVAFPDDKEVISEALTERFTYVQPNDFNFEEIKETGLVQ